MEFLLNTTITFDYLYRAKDKNPTILTVLIDGRLASSWNEAIVLWTLNNEITEGNDIVIGSKILVPNAELEIKNPRVLCMVVIDANRLASGTEDKKIIIWNTDTLENIQEIEENESISSLGILTGNRLLSVSINKGIELIDLSNYTSISYSSEIKGLDTKTFSFVELPDNRIAAYSTHNIYGLNMKMDHKLRIWDLTNEKYIDLENLNDFETRSNYPLILLNDGVTLVSVSNEYENVIDLWDTANIKRENQKPIPIKRFEALGGDEIVFFNLLKGNRLVSGSKKGKIIIWK